MNHDYLVRKGVLATKGQRFANFIIDYIIQLIVGFVFGVILFFISEIFNASSWYNSWIETDNRLTDYIFGAIILLIYYSIIEGLTGRSIGKYITNTRVITEEGNKPSFQDAILRSLCRIIPFEAFSFLVDLGRGWHDSMTNTYVVDAKKYDAAINSESEIDQIGKIEEFN